MSIKIIAPLEIKNDPAGIVVDAARVGYNGGNIAGALGGLPTGADFVRLRQGPIIGPTGPTTRMIIPENSWGRIYEVDGALTQVGVQLETPGVNDVGKIIGIRIAGNNQNVLFLRGETEIFIDAPTTGRTNFYRVYSYLGNQNQIEYSYSLLFSNFQPVDYSQQIQDVNNRADSLEAAVSERLKNPAEITTLDLQKVIGATIVSDSTFASLVDIDGARVYWKATGGILALHLYNPNQYNYLNFVVTVNSVPPDGINPDLSVNAQNPETAYDPSLITEFIFSSVPEGIFPFSIVSAADEINISGFIKLFIIDEAFIEPGRQYSITDNVNGTITVLARSKTAIWPFAEQNGIPGKLNELCAFIADGSGGGAGGFPVVLANGPLDGEVPVWNAALQQYDQIAPAAASTNNDGSISISGGDISVNQSFSNNWQSEQYFDNLIYANAGLSFNYQRGTNIGDTIEPFDAASALFVKNSISGFTGSSGFLSTIEIDFRQPYSYFSQNGGTTLALAVGYNDQTDFLCYGHVKKFIRNGNPNGSISVTYPSGWFWIGPPPTTIAAGKFGLVEIWNLDPTNSFSPFFAARWTVQS